MCRGESGFGERCRLRESGVEIFLYDGRFAAEARLRSAASLCHRVELRALRCAEQFFRVQEAGIRETRRQISTRQELAIVEPVGRGGERIARARIERERLLVRVSRVARAVPPSRAHRRDARAQGSEPWCRLNWRLAPRPGDRRRLPDRTGASARMRRLVRLRRPRADSVLELFVAGAIAGEFAVSCRYASK